MLSYEASQNLSKAQLYEIYVATYKKMEEKDDIIKKHMLTVSDYLTRSNPSQPTSHHTSASNNQVRSFQAFDIREKNKQPRDRKQLGEKSDEWSIYPWRRKRACIQGIYYNGKIGFDGAISRSENENCFITGRYKFNTAQQKQRYQWTGRWYMRAHTSD